MGGFTTFMMCGWWLKVTLSTSGRPAASTVTIGRRTTAREAMVSYAGQTGGQNMRRSTHWLVADHGIRPAGPPDRCFYCDEPMGGEHKDGCVIRSRTVVVRFHVDLVVNVPEHWDPSEVESSFNVSSWCGGNLAASIADTSERMPGCMCGFVTAEFVSEATEEDENDQGLRVNELPS